MSEDLQAEVERLRAELALWQKVAEVASWALRLSKLRRVAVPYDREPVHGEESGWRTVRLPDGRNRVGRWRWADSWAAPRWEVRTWRGEVSSSLLPETHREYRTGLTREEADALLAEGELRHDLE